jgi:hypothetical protein
MVSGTLPRAANLARGLFDDLFDADVPLQTRLDPGKLAGYLREDAVLAPVVISPFGGVCPLVFADQASTARPLRCVEEAIRNRILPLYGSTVSAKSSYLGRSMSIFRDGARLVP